MLALAGCTGLAGLGIVFVIFYPGEIAFAIDLAALMIVLAWNTGTLRVFSKLTRDRGWAVWWIKPLHRMRDAIEAAIEDRSRPRRSPPPAPPPMPDNDETIRIAPPRPPRR